MRTLRPFDVSSRTAADLLLPPRHRSTTRNSASATTSRLQTCLERITDRQYQTSVKSEYGKGRVAFLPGDPDERFWYEGISTDLALFREAMEYVLDGDRPIEIDRAHHHRDEPHRDCRRRYDPRTPHQLRRTAHGDAEGLREGRGAPRYRHPGTAGGRHPHYPPRKPAGRNVERVRLHSTDLDETLDLAFQESDRAVSFEIPLLWIYDVIAVDWR